MGLEAIRKGAIHSFNQKINLTNALPFPEPNMDATTPANSNEKMLSISNPDVHDCLIGVTLVDARNGFKK